MSQAYMRIYTRDIKDIARYQKKSQDIRDTTRYQRYHKITRDITRYHKILTHMEMKWYDREWDNWTWYNVTRLSLERTYRYHNTPSITLRGHHKIHHFPSDMKSTHQNTLTLVEITSRHLIISRLNISWNQIYGGISRHHRIGVP
jgi:hypothetical protein